MGQLRSVITLGNHQWPGTIPILTRRQRIIRFIVVLSDIMDSAEKLYQTFVMRIINEAIPPNTKYHAMAFDSLLSDVIIIIGRNARKFSSIPNHIIRYVSPEIAISKPRVRIERNSVIDGEMLNIKEERS